MIENPGNNGYPGVFRSMFRDYQVIVRTAPHEDERNTKRFAITRTEWSADQAVRGSLVIGYSRP